MTSMTRYIYNLIGRQRQEACHEFEASVGYIACIGQLRLWSKTLPQTNKHKQQKQWHGSYRQLYQSLAVIL